jgi:hypothetical protein
LQTTTESPRETSKRCPKCGETKPFPDFGKDRSRKDGHRVWCRECERKNLKSWRARNIEQFLETDRAWKRANPEKVRENRRRTSEKNYEQVMVRNARARARSKNLPFNLTRQDIVIPTVCPVFGFELDRRRGLGYTRKNGRSPSLDRIVPEHGYVPGNVVVVSHRANSLRNDFSPDDMRRFSEVCERMGSRGAADEWRKLVAFYEPLLRAKGVQQSSDEQSTDDLGL